MFLGAYLVNELTRSPLRVQLVGTMFYLPMFLGGIVAGVVSDRFDRRRTMMRHRSRRVWLNGSASGLFGSGRRMNGCSTAR